MGPIQKNDTKGALEDLQRYLSATPALLFFLDEEGVIHFVSGSVSKYFGTKTEKIRGKNWHDADLPPDLYKIFDVQNTAVLHTGRSERGKIRYFMAQEERWLEYDISPVADPEGSIEGTVVTIVDSTDHKRMENSLRQTIEDREESHRMLNAVFKYMPAGITITAGPPDFRIRAVSDYAIRTIGIPREKLIGVPAGKHQDVWGLRLPDGTRPRPEDMSLYRAVMYGEEVNSIELSLQPVEGRKIPIIESASPIRDSDGKIIAAINVWRDISYIKKAEEALRESEAKYRGLFENIHEGVSLRRLIYDEQGEIVDAITIDANPSALKVYGVSSVEELKGKRYGETASPRMRLEALDMVRRMRTIGRPVTHEEHSDINDRDYLVTVTPLEEDLVITTSVDISDIKQAQYQVEESEAKFRALFENIHEGVSLRRLIYDDKGEFIDSALIEANPAALKAYGVGSIEELRAEKYGIKAGPEIKDLAIDIANGLKATGEPVTKQTHLDANGRDYIVTVAPLWNNMIITTSVDITDFKRTENELEEARSRAQLYIDLLSHDINNYNTAAMGYLQLAKSKLKLDDKDKKLIIKPLEDLRNSTELIANVRDIQKLEEGIDITEPMDICAILREIKEEYQNPFAREVTISIEERDHCSARASNLLRSVFSNIVGNSIKHSIGAVNVLMILSTISYGGKDHARISIEDNGPGIPDEMKENIFARSLHGLTRRTGHGLGLYLVKRIVEDHGGKVWAEDRVPGDHTQGARFVVLLPIS